MIGATETLRNPEELSAEEIQIQIAQRRAALDAKIHELERRLSPREQMARMRSTVSSRMSPEPYLGLMAAGAVAAGAALAYRGLRRSRPAARNGEAAILADDCALAEVLGE